MLDDARKEYSVTYLEEFTRDGVVEAHSILSADAETLTALLAREEPTQQAIGEAAERFKEAHFAAIRARANARRELYRWIDHIARREAHAAAKTHGANNPD